jgi:hypothetical protein
MQKGETPKGTRLEHRCAACPEARCAASAARALARAQSKTKSRKCEKHRCAASAVRASARAQSKTKSSAHSAHHDRSDRRIVIS